MAKNTKTILVLAVAAAAISTTGFGGSASAALSGSAPNQSAVAKLNVAVPSAQAGVADGADRIKMPRIRVAPTCGGAGCSGHKG